MKPTLDTQLKERQLLSKFEGLFGVLFLLLAGLIFLNSDLFSIKKVEVTGNQGISTEDILFEAQISRYKNIFQVDRSKMCRAILKDLRIASVEVSRNFPSSILITVRERNPCCFFLFADNLLIVGEDGVVMGVKNEDDPVKLPIISGVKLPPVKVGQKIEGSQFRIALEILKLADENLRQALSEINLKNGELYLDLPNSKATIKVELGDLEEIEKKIYNLRAILSHTSPGELQTIDLRVPESPTVLSSKSLN
jgi:cell division protein FtsQ